MNDTGKIDDFSLENKEDRIIGDAIYFKRLVEFQKDKNFFQIKVEDSVRFERALEELKVDFHKVDPEKGLVEHDIATWGLGFPSVDYYIKNQDLNVVYDIIDRLKINKDKKIPPSGIELTIYFILFFIMIILLSMVISLFIN